MIEKRKGRRNKKSLFPYIYANNFLKFMYFLFYFINFLLTRLSILFALKLNHVLKSIRVIPLEVR